MIEWNLTEKYVGELTETIEGSDWTGAKMNAMNLLKAQGQEMEDSVIVQLALNTRLDKIFQDGVKKFNLVPMTKPKIDIKNLTNESVTVGLTFAVKPEVKLGDIRGIRYSVADVEVTESDIEQGIRVYLESKARREDTNAPAEQGNSLTLDYDVTIDGEKLELGSEEDAVIVLGSGVFIPGFEDKLTGAVAGEKRSFTIDFPEDYGVDELNGKQAQFDVEIKKVQKTVLPDLNEDFIKTLKIEGVSTMEQFRSHVKITVAKAMRQHNQEVAEQKLIDDLMAACEVEVPQLIVDTEVGTMMQRLNAELAQKQTTLVEYLEMQGQSADEFLQNLRSAAERNVTSSLCFEQVAVENRLFPSNSEIEGEYKVMAMRFQMDVEEVKKRVPVDQLSYEMQLNKAMDFLKNMGKKDNRRVSSGGILLK